MTTKTPDTDHIKKRLYRKCLDYDISYKDIAALFDEDESVLEVFAEHHYIFDKYYQSEYARECRLNGFYNYPSGS